MQSREVNYAVFASYCPGIPIHPNPNPFPLSLRILQARFFRESFRFEGCDKQAGGIAIFTVPSVDPSLFLLKDGDILHFCVMF
jgi:hypothetical protein